MNDLPRISTVTVIGATTLSVVWRDGAAHVVDLAGWIGRGNPHIAPLAAPDVFARAAVGEWGADVTWDNAEGDLAIDNYHLRTIAEHQAPFAATDAAAWQVEMGVSNAEAADLLAVAPSTWSSYKAGASIPETVARLCRALRSDPVVLSAHLRPRTPGRPRASM